MKKISKRIYILAPIIIVIVIFLIGMNNYTRPITIHKVFTDAIVTRKDGNEELKKATIEIDAKVFRGIYTGSIRDINVHFTNRLEGKIIIDNKEYSFWGITGKPELINIIGTIHEKNSTSDVFWFVMNDLNTIELLSVDEKSGYDYKINATVKQ